MCCNVAFANVTEGQGSLGFMAPEALLKHVPDPTKLDVWSIACVLLELVRRKKKYALILPVQEGRIDHTLFPELPSTR